MSGPTTVYLPHKVSPGDEIDLSVDLIAPDLTGTYQGNWMLMDDSGIRFGTGAEARNVFWVKIQVGNVASNLIYDFAANYCKATWENAEKELPCPGKGSESSGFVIRLENPELETRHENEPALETFPQMVDDGWIAGYFPPIQIKSGYHFFADIGCLAGYPKCNVKFLLKYQIGTEKIETLGEWHEVYDGAITSLDINLKPFAKQEVKFIFVVEANGSFEQDAAFWFVPKIIDVTVP
jgi:Ig-like domain from next to BRCA1 gene